MENWESVYEKWNTYEQLDPRLSSELDALAGDRTALEDAFYKELSFGTGGMRGVMGAGTNRMNIYTIRKAVNGLAEYLFANRVNVKDRGVVIAYDTRYKSQEFAIETARVLGAHGIKAYVFESMRPTPLLPFAVRYLGTAAGVMITASHNPPEYNGFKVYNEDGGQITPTEAEAIIEAIGETENELTIDALETADLESRDLLNWRGEEIDNAYLEQLKQMSKLPEAELSEEKKLPIVFTPLHGTAYDLVMKGLDQLNFSQVNVVKEQAEPDPEFSTVDSPNPEEHQAFTLAIEQGRKNDAHVLLGTDPDADRLGVAVKNKAGDYQVLTGNQLGVLLLDYILRHSDPVMLKSAHALKTVVTTEMGRAVADAYDVATTDTLTGFKYIGEKIHEFDANGKTFVFGFEESYGYLISSFVRDKDAVQAAAMSCEMAYYWDKQGKTLLDALDTLYEQHGYFQEDMTSLTLKGKEGSEQIEHIMTDIRSNPLESIAGFQVGQAEDYLAGERTMMTSGKKEMIQLPKENMMKFILDCESWVCLRPSGTEPKIKCYYGVRGETEEKARVKLAALKSAMDQVIGRIIHSA